MNESLLVDLKKKNKQAKQAIDASLSILSTFIALSTFSTLNTPRPGDPAHQAHSATSKLDRPGDVHTENRSFLVFEKKTGYGPRDHPSDGPTNGHALI